MKRYFWSLLWEIEFCGEYFCCTWKSRAIKNSAIFPFAFYLGEKLLPGDKHVMTEYALSEYSRQMNLTVNSLEKRDFGGYVCSSVNALGKADGVVRLQGTENSQILFKIVFRQFPSSSPAVSSWLKSDTTCDTSDNNIWSSTISVCESITY